MYGGDACIAVNGNVVAKQTPFQLTDVDVVTADVDLEEIRVYRHSMRSRCTMAAQTQPFPKVEVCSYILLYFLDIVIFFAISTVFYPKYLRIRSVQGRAILTAHLINYY